MRTDHIKDRNMFAQLVLYIITLGIYGIYWYYSTLKELHIANGKDEGAGIWTFLMFIPIANLFAVWHYGSEVGTFTNDKYPAFVILLMWIIFSPIVWVLVQLELNKAARGPERRQSVMGED